MRKRLFQYWPILGLISIGLLNMEFVVIPIILIGILDLWGLELRIAAMICATLEICYWYWFSGWVMHQTKGGSTIKGTIKDGSSFGRDVVATKARESNIVGSTKKWIKKQQTKFRPESHENNWLYQKIHRYGKATAKGVGKVSLALLLIAVTSLPLPYISALLWIPSLVACRAVNWHKGLTFLIIGNAIKNWMYAGAAMYLIEQI